MPYAFSTQNRTFTCTSSAGYFQVALSAAAPQHTIALGSYPAGRRCYWDIAAPDGFRVSFKVKAFNTVQRYVKG